MLVCSFSIQGVLVGVNLNPILLMRLLLAERSEYNCTHFLENEALGAGGDGGGGVTLAVFHLEKWTRGGKIILRENLGGPRDCARRCSL